MKKILFLIALAVFSMLSFTVSAQPQHPHYLEALGDLRDARWLLIHRGANDPGQVKEEKIAIAEIDAAIKEITDAAIDDGKSLDHAPHEDNKVYAIRDRLRAAYAYLQEADTNILHRDPNPISTDLRNRSHAHIKEAKRNIDALWTIYKVPR